MSGVPLHLTLSFVLYEKKRTINFHEVLFTFKREKSEKGKKGEERGRFTLGSALRLI